MVSLRKVFIAGAAVLGAFVLPAAANAQQSVTAYTSADLNLREGPGTEFRVLLAMPRGSQVQVSYCSSENVWCFVQYGHSSGWASSRFLTNNPPQYAQQPQYQQPQYQQPQQQVAVAQPPQHPPAYQPPAYQPPAYQPPAYQPPAYQPNYPVGAVPYPYYRPYGFSAWLNLWFR